jgi:hypothetical protein
MMLGRQLPAKHHSNGFLYMLINRKVLSNMKYRFTLLFFFSLFVFQSSGWGQASSCNYTLELKDGFGDGWNGASLLVSINGAARFYELDNETDNGFLERIELTIQSGDQLSITYNRGLYDEEIAWSLTSPEGEVLISFNGTPTTGLVFEQTLECPACLGPQIDEILLEDVRASTADIRWLTDQSSTGIYFLEYGISGFTQGSGTVVQTAEDEIRLSGLQENTRYDFYLAVSCENGEDSKIVGPISFRTRYANDARIARIENPITSCDLGFNDTVKVIIQNLGGDPQTLIPFKYDVNELGINISMPTDGLYTGVLGKDSTDIAFFDQTFNFANPGEYNIKAWTELGGDSFPANDTFETTIVSIPEITNYPYFEEFEVWGGGWTVSSDSESPSWMRGQPAGNLINSAAGGNNAWVTNLNGSYNFAERSYLVSPCFDFSSFTDDPQISFSLYVDTEEEFDGAWLEVSTDDGESWTKAGNPDSGVLWYNNAQTQVWDGDGGFSGWSFAANTLNGTAGFERVRLRFVFSSDINVNKEGIGIDNVLISSPFNADLAAVTVASTATDACGSTEDNVVLTVRNLGATGISVFDLNYQVGADGEVVTETIRQTLAPGGQETYQFETSFNSFAQESVDITAWVSVPAGDEFVGNDTVRISLSTLRQLPFGEDFEGQRLPDGWSSDGVVTNEHNNRSYVISGNLTASNSSFSAETPLVGPVAASDSLTFEYRFVSQSGDGNVGEALDEGDQLEVQISTDCGQNYTTLLTIDATNHNTTPLLSRRVVFLSDYEGETVRFRFLASRGADSYWVDIDNINITRCPPSLALNLTATDETGFNAGNGSASVETGAGEGPFNYLWSNGDITKNASKLSAGVYTVTVTDRFGCQDEGEILVGLNTNTEEVRADLNKVQLYPNPTRGAVRLELTLSEVQDINLQVLNLVGQKILEQVERDVKQLSYSLDLSSLPNGVYFVRVRAGGEQVVKKLIKSN